MRFFIDASFLIASFNDDDEFYPRAKRLMSKLKEEKANFILSNIVLAETTNFIFRFLGVRAAERFLKTIRQSDTEEIFVDKDIFSQGYKILFQQRSKRGLNLFDCLHLATMKKLGIKKILTFDQDFAKEAEVIN